MSTWLKFFLAGAMALCGQQRGCLFAESPPLNGSWAYRLVADSYLIDECLICGRPTIQLPLRGSFTLRLLESNPLFARFALEDIAFAAGDGLYRVSGTGTYQLGGEVAVVQHMTLAVDIDNGFSTNRCYFTNEFAPVERLRPMLDVTLVQTNGTLTQQYTVRIAAAPLREIWFSTKTFLMSSNSEGRTSIVQHGDLISTTGRVVKRNSDFYGSVGATPPGPDLGLDAVDVLPGGEMAFSLDSGFPMSNVGPIYHGDLLSTRGRVIRRNQELTAAFGLMPAVPDVGLDAVRVLSDGEIWFSIETNIFSERLSIMLGRGDLLSSTGGVVRTQRELLSRFHPVQSEKEYGLDAVYVWGSGEIWFSTEESFDDSSLGPISNGDLLSDQGYVVYRNADLLKAFSPTKPETDYGLDALYVITDAISPAGAPRLSIEANKPESQSVRLSWSGAGRVFQVERSGVVNGAFQPLSPILPDLSFDDMGALSNRTESFYRLRQW